ncbi:MAG: hypothetical protein KME22_05645 [Hassallia sp. WJT32-NPBG1]|nr:hypothetical protein [Hassallia sp. WJT32-NPBG1]
MHYPCLSQVGVLSSFCDRAYNVGMKRLQIQHFSAINGYILLVFYSPGKCWQFRVISPDGSVYGFKNIFYTSEAARKAGVSWLGSGRGSRPITLSKFPQIIPRLHPCLLVGVFCCLYSRL